MVRKDVRIVTFGQVFVTTLLNPKALLFAFALYPHLEEGQSILPYIPVFAATVVCMASGWITFGAFVGRMGEGNMGRLLPRIAGVVLSVLAMVIAGSMVAARI
jgi:threonine/homoserine/homoserine lactone efflux protein